MFSLIFFPSSTFAAVKGEFDQASLISTTTRPTLSGEISGASVVRVLVENEKGKNVYKSKDIKAKGGEWKTKVSKLLTVGKYKVTLYSVQSGKQSIVTTGTLTILSKKGTPTTSSSGTKKPTTSSASGGTLSASPVPLLWGGNAAHGASIPVAYVKLINTGKTTTSIDGFRLIENGSAPDDVVIGFSVSDDKGGSRATIGGFEGSKQFNKGSAFVPLPATLAPGQLRIFTIKAILSRDSGIHFGKQLLIDVAGVEGKASTKGTFPMRGTTWTLTY